MTSASSLPDQPNGDLLRAASGVFFELLTFEDLLQTIMDKVIEVTQSTKGFLILVGPAGDLEFKVARNMKKEEIENPKNSISRNLIRRVVEEGKSVLTGHAGEDPRFQDVESVHNLMLKSLLCVPLRFQGRVGGVIYLENHLTAGVFDQRKQDMVQRVAEDASLTLGLTRAMESLKGERDRLAEENQSFREIFQANYEFGHFVCRSPAMRKVAEQMSRIAGTRHTVLIRGESGTGKELVTRILHATGPWRDQPLVAVNIAAVPAGLFESELFGHVKGAFTGADRNRMGKAEAANGGTLFLDEVGDLPLDIQPKLLRLLQEKTFERIGENQTRSADIRVIAATNRDLEALVERGQFRDDLYWRLNQLPLTLPPLRERPEDVEGLAEYFLRLEKRGIPGFTENAVALLRNYPWPGNVRELKSAVVHAAVFTTDGEPIGVEALRAKLEERVSLLQQRQRMLHFELSSDLDYRSAKAELEAAYLRAMLARHAGLSRAELADAIGIPRRTLFQRLKDLGIGA